MFYKKNKTICMSAFLRTTVSISAGK